MFRPYKPSIPSTLGELYVLLGFMVIKAPTFEDPIFPGRNVETVFFQLNEGLAAARSQLGESRFVQLTALSRSARAHFEADPEDRNGRTREGRKLIQEMEAIVLHVAQPSEYPPLTRGDMIVLANRLRSLDGTPQELDTIADQLLVALPSADVMALLFDTIDVPVEQAIDEALRREELAAQSRPSSH